MKHLKPVLAVLFALPGCAPLTASTEGRTEVDLDVAWSPSDAISTAGTLSWMATENSVGAVVEYGPTGDYGQTAPQTELGTVVLAGLSPDTTYHYRISGDDWVSPDLTLAIGALPDGLQELDLVASDGSDWGGLILTTLFVDGAPGQLQVVDKELNPLWWSDSPTTFVWNARWSADHRSIYYLQGSGGLDGELVQVGLTGDILARYPAPYGHHDFVELPTGDLAYLASTVREWNGWQVVGDQVIVTGANGESRVVWDTFDDLVPVEEDHWQSTISQFGADWTHANGLTYDEADDAFLVSSFYLEALYKVDASSGELLWQLGGDDSDFTFPDDRGFGPQHSPVITPEGVLLFDNSGPTNGSRVVEYALDDDAFVASRAMEMGHPSGAWCGTFASASRLPSGAITSTWGERGEAIVQNADGSLAWEAEIDNGSMIFGMQVFDSLYPPS